MYTLGAVFGVIVVLALAQIANHKSQITNRKPHLGHRTSHIVHRTSYIVHRQWWAIYAVAAAAGMYTLYYFAFLLIPLNLWVLARCGSASAFHERRPLEAVGESLAHLPICDLRFAVRPPSSSPTGPPRSSTSRGCRLPSGRRPTRPCRPGAACPLLASVMESVNALALGQSAPGWLWPVAVLALGVYVLGWVANQQIGKSAIGISKSANQQRTSEELRIHRSSFLIHHSSFPLPVATFGPLALILGVSLITPLYHVRYLFTYSPAFYIVLGAGGAWLWARRRWAAGLALAVWLVAAAVTLSAFWFDPEYRPDDHRAAVQALQARWRPGDVLLVNVGYAYPPLLTYWQGPIACRVRLTEPLPPAWPDDAPGDRDDGTSR